MASIITSIFRASSVANSLKGLVQEKNLSKIGDLFIDAAIEEDVTLESVITEYPLEDKTAITDHIYNKPIKITIRGYITDSPIRFMGLIETPLQNNSLSKFIENAKSLTPFVDSKTPSQRAYELLESIRDKKQLVTVVTKLKSFRNMAIEDIFVPQNSQNQGGLEFKITLKQVNYSVVKTTVNVNSKIGRVVQPKTKMGIDPMLEAKPTQEVKSVWDKVKEYVKSRIEKLSPDDVNMMTGF